MNGCVYRTADNQCEKFSDPFRNTLSWCVGDTTCEARKLSNADRRRSMSDEQLAEWLASIVECDDGCPCIKECGEKEELGFCYQSMLEWLRKEAKDD